MAAAGVLVPTAGNAATVAPADIGLKLDPSKIERHTLAQLIDVPNALDVRIDGHACGHDLELFLDNERVNAATAYNIEGQWVRVVIGGKNDVRAGDVFECSMLAKDYGYPEVIRRGHLMVRRIAPKHTVTVYTSAG